MHRLINVCINNRSIHLSTVSNLKLLTEQEGTRNMLHAYLDLENYTIIEAKQT